jgi:SAM-dependent methyltransferase
MILNLGSGQTILPTAINVDLHIPTPWQPTTSLPNNQSPKAIKSSATLYLLSHPNTFRNPRFVKHDLDQHPWPFTSSSVTIIKAHHVLEHLRRPIQALNEAHRILKPDGILDLRLPIAGTPEDHTDPTHRTSWTPASLDFLDAEANPDYRPTNHLWQIQNLDVDHAPADPWYAWHAREWLNLELGRPTEIKALMRPVEDSPHAKQ